MADENRNDASPDCVVPADGSSSTSASVGDAWDWFLRKRLCEAQYIIADESWEHVLAETDETGHHVLPTSYGEGMYVANQSSIVEGCAQIIGDGLCCSVLFRVWDERRYGHDKDENIFSVERCVVILELHDKLDHVPDMCKWVDIRRHSIYHTEEEAQEAIAKELQYRREGVYPPHRPEWSHRGWFLKTSAWFVEQLESRGKEVNWGVEFKMISQYCTVLLAETEEGDFYLRASPWYCNEAAISLLLSSVDPMHVRVPFVADVGRGLMINRDYGEATGFYLLRLTESRKFFRSYAKLQMASTAILKELADAGLPVVSLEWAEAQLDVLCNDEEIRRWEGTEEFELFLEHKEDLRVLLKKLMKLSEGMPMALVHGILEIDHAYRSQEEEGEFCFFDWTFAYISHPMSGLVETNETLELYMEEWSSVISLKTLEEMRLLCKTLDGYLFLWSSLTYVRKLDENGKRNCDYFFHLA